MGGEIVPETCGKTDIKPQNILITQNGKVKITDFGIARALSSTTITQKGMFIGSPGYVSPEQADGKKIGPTSDLYSFGVLLFEMLSKKLPFTSDTPWGIVNKHINEAPPDISKLVKDIPPYLSYIVSKCLVKSPEGRFLSADEIIGAFKSKSYASETVIKDIRVDKPKIDYYQAPPKAKSSNAKKVWIAVGAVAAFIIIISIIVSVVNRVNRETVEAVEEVAPAEEAVEEAVEAVEEAVETGSEEVLSGFELYEELRGYAKAMADYPDAPAAGYSLAFTNIIGGIPFCEEIWSSIQRQWTFAGGTADKLYYADNQYDADLGLQNADIMLAKNPDCFINFQFDSKVNSIISNKYAQAGIPVIAVDVPTPDAPFVGINNFQVAYMAGETAIEYVEVKGGIDMIDNIVLMQMPSGGEVVMLRSEGFYQAFVDKYGADVIDPITIRADGGAGEADQANKAMKDVLATIPDAENVILTSINAQTMSGFLTAIQTSGRWDPNKWIVITQGCDSLGRTQLRSGDTDASIAYFPETYGQYLVPAAIALMLGQPVPAFMYIENEAITIENINSFYAE